MSAQTTSSIVVGPDNKLYEIKYVLDDTHLTLVEPYSGETQTDVPCRIITTYEGDLTQFSARFAALMTRMYADSKSMRAWLTALDAVTIEREDGTEVTVKPLMQIVNEHNANLEWYKENKEILDASAAGAKKSAESAAASAADAAGSSRQSVASASLASEKANAADASAAAAKSSETAVSEKADAAEGAKLAAQTAESNAGKQANAAAGSATQAQQYATNAKREADRAQTISNEINSTVDKLLQKDQNLADITNPGAARVSLGVERVTQGPTDERWKRRPGKTIKNGFKARWTSKMRLLMKCDKRILLLFIASCMISGCVIDAPKTGVLFCDGANPIYVSKEDFMTEETEREILFHNTIGERLCKW
ncbi:hypothetical protein CsakCS931_35280 (plasmid) [Cronobacter sakazakii]|nr:hypothetical protein CsakCS931_35280 [Cronobacter sakazakii]